jgi:hypothetical protein
MLAITPGPAVFDSRVSGEAAPVTPGHHDPVARFVRFTLAGALLLLAVQSVAHLAASIHFHSYDSLLDLDRNNGIPDVLSSVMIVTAAFGALALAASSPRDRWQAGALALLLAIVAFDDVSQKEAGNANAWAMSVIMTLALTTLLVLTITRRAPRSAALALLVGLGLLVAAVKNAYVAPYDQLLEMLGHSGEQRGHLDYELGIVLKQGLEFLGWSLVAIGLWATALAARIQSRSQPFVNALWVRTQSLDR